MIIVIKVYFIRELKMKIFHIQVTLITPISESPFKVNFFYNDILQDEEWLMPWETGLSKEVSFYMHCLNNDFDINHFQILPNGQENNDDITIESIMVNDQLEKITTNTNPHSYALKDVVNIDPKNGYSVVKIHSADHDMHVSYSYSCNGNIYVPLSEIDLAMITIPAECTQNRFKVDLFKRDITIPETRKEIYFEKGRFFTQDIALDDIHHLQARLTQEFEKNNFDKQAHYHAVLDIDGLQFDDIILDDQRLSIPLKDVKALNPDVSISIYNSDNGECVKSIGFKTDQKEKKLPSQDMDIYKKSA